MAPIHEFRDPVHQFIYMTTGERRIVDSRPVQRLRNIHQLAMSYLVYPGATHKRFEHSLGVMELAGQVFDVVTNRHNTTDQLRHSIPELNEEANFPYWRTVVRVAALCHDVGHLPFSHAAEHDILPEGTSHETLTEEIILSEDVSSVLWAQTPPIIPAMVAKIAVGREKASDDDFSVWEGLLSEIITGDAFGVDRMDYLIRDSLHTGVAYGTFDHHRLIQCLRILPSSPQGADDQLGTSPGGAANEPVIGVESGGLQAAESLLLARYLMFSQVYFHPVRVIYDAHLVDFVREWLDGSTFSDSESVGEYLDFDDSDLLVRIKEAASRPASNGHRHATRIMRRNHMRRVYERTPADKELVVDPAANVERWACERYGEENVRRKASSKSSGSVEFPVQEFSGMVASSLTVSETLRHIPDVSLDRVYVDVGASEEAKDELGENRNTILEEHDE